MNQCYNSNRQNRQQACNEKKTPLAEGAFFIFLESPRRFDQGQHKL